MSEFFRHGEGFGAVLKQLDEVFLDDIAESVQSSTFLGIQFLLLLNPMHRLTIYFETFLTPKEVLTDADADNTTDADSSIITADSMTGHESDSESELWDCFNFPHLTPEEDAQLTIALQGGTMANQSHMCSVVQGMTVHDLESGPSPSPIYARVS